jgi:hypothetical protein
MATTTLARKFWQDGFLVLEDFFEGALMAELDRLIRDHFGDDPGFEHSDEFLSEAKTEVIPWFPQNDGPGAFDEIDEHDALHELTGAILGEGWRPDYCMVMFSKQGSAGQAWHQDCPPDSPNQFNINRLVYTSDISDEAGGQVVVVPRSHQEGILPTGDPTGHFDGEVVLRPRKGTLVLLHGHTWHRVLPVAGRCRYSANYRAVTRDTPKDITDICVYRNMRYRFSTSSIVEQRV